MTTPNITYARFESPIGTLLTIAADDALTHLHMESGKYAPSVPSTWQNAPDAPVHLQTQRELNEYFSGKRTSFSVKLAPRGTPFQQAAWAALCEIPFGETRSYGAQALAIGNPKAVRAIGAANGRNPIAIIIPCHRVIGASGTLTGYAGGIEKKHFLLRHEGILLA